MAKKLTCLVLALVLTFALAATAFAVDTLNMMYVDVFDEGNLGVIVGTDYTDDADMNFAASTEIGELEILQASVMRKEGTSWFVILEYGNYTNEAHQKTAKRVLKKISEMIDDKDDGALVRCDSYHEVTMEKANTLRDTLQANPQKSDASELANTIKGVMNYIGENRASLMPNVAVIVVTACPSGKVNDNMIDDIGNTLSAYRYISTHIVVTAGKDVYKQDRPIGQRLADKAKQLTVGGTGYVTEKLVDDEADKSIQMIVDAERRKLQIVVSPKNVNFVGKELTIRQTTAGGKELSDTATLPDDFVEAWKTAVSNRDPGYDVTQPSGSSDSNPVVYYNGPSTYSSGLIFVPQEEEPAGLSTELLIGIIAGVVILTLLAVLLILRAVRNKKPAAKAPVYTASSSASKAQSGTTVSLAGDNGAALKGAMKNNILTIGRNGAKAMLAVPNDGKLSGLHATLTKAGNAMTVTDNGSTNGTKLNGVKLDPGKPTPIQQNDKLTLGSTTYTISWRG